MKTNKNNTDNNIVKKYDLMALYDPRCTKLVRATVEEKKIPTKLICDTYLYIKDLTAEQVDTYKTILSECNVKSSDGNKTYKIRFSSYKCDSVLPKVEKKSETEEMRKPADPRNKADKRKRAENHASKMATKRSIEAATRKTHAKENNKGKLKANPAVNDKKKELDHEVPVYGKSRKKIMFRRGRNKFKNANVVTPGTKEDNLAKRMRQRALKAGKYLVKKEKQEAVEKPVMKVKKGGKKPVQKELALAA